MKKVLFLAHNEENGLLSKLSLESLTAAKKLATDLSVEFSVGLFGKNLSKVSNQIFSSNPKDVYVVDGDEFQYSRYSTDSKAIEEICKAAQASYIICSSTSRMLRVIPGVAFRLNGKIDTFVTDLFVEGLNLQIKRWYYRQRMQALLTRDSNAWFMTIAAGNFEPFTSQDGVLEYKKLSVKMSEDINKTKVEDFVSPHGGAQTLKPEAKLLFVAGAGWSKKQANGSMRVNEAAEIILSFLQKSDASLGGSKSVVDMSGDGEAVLSFMTHLNQVGQTGSTPSHQKGLATCCHGEEPHVIGWRFIGERRAVNTDPNCGWAHGKTDVLYVADAFEVMTKVIELLEK